MNVNLMPRRARIGNGTFRGSFLGAGFWSATKHYFTASTSPTRVYDPLRLYDFTRDQVPMPYDAYAMARIIQPYMDREDLSMSEVTALITTLSQTIKDNEAYETKVRDYYGLRVDRTSGSKRDRLRAERAALIGESTAARNIAAAAIKDLRSGQLAKVKGSMKTDPDFVMSRKDESGGIVYEHSDPADDKSGAKPGAKPGAKSGKDESLGWLLPAGAGLAAYFMMKG